jgi:hypothetical protein
VETLASDGLSRRTWTAIFAVQAALGTEIEIPTLTGMEKLKIAAGTQPGQVFRLRGKGFPHLRGSGAGDQLCRIVVEEGRFRLAWVGILDPESREVRPVAGCGETAYLEGLRIMGAHRGS